MPKKSVCENKKTYKNKKCLKINKNRELMKYRSTDFLILKS